MLKETFGYYCTLSHTPFSQAKEMVVAALEEEGFSVITEIDMKVILKEKLNLDFRNYLILGACNPNLASLALVAEPHAGLMLPCNVVIQDRMGADGVVVSLQNPKALSTLVDNERLDAIAQVAEARIHKVLERLGAMETSEEDPDLESVGSISESQYPGKGLKKLFANRRELLSGIRDHYPSEGLNI